MSNEASTTKLAQYRTARLVSRALRSQSKPQEVTLSPEHMEMFQNVYTNRSSLDGASHHSSSSSRPLSKSKKMPLSIGNYDMFIIPKNDVLLASLEQHHDIPPPPHSPIDIDAIPAPPPFSPPASPEVPPPPDTTPPPSPSPMPDKRFRNMMEQLHSRLSPTPEASQESSRVAARPSPPPPPPRPQSQPLPPPPMPKRPVAHPPTYSGDTLSPHELLCREINRGVKLRHVSVRSEPNNKKHGHAVTGDSSLKAACVTQLIDSAFANILARRRHLESFSTTAGDGRESYLWS